MELNLGAEAPPAARPNLAMLLGRQPAAPQPVAPQAAPQAAPQPSTTTEETTVSQTTTTTEAPSFDDLNQTTAAPETSETPETSEAPESKAALVAVPSDKPLPRGAGVVDYREGLNDLPESSNASIDELQAAEDAASSGATIVGLTLPYSIAVPALDKDGNPKMKKDGKPSLKKVPQVLNATVNLSEADLGVLTDSSAIMVLSHIVKNAVDQMSAQGVEPPAGSKFSIDWLTRHFGQSSFYDVITSLMTPWTLTASTGKVASVVQNALMCNTSVDGTTPAEFVAQAITYMKQLFIKHTKNVTGKEPTATASSAAVVVLTQLESAYVRFDKSMAAYEESVEAYEAAEAAGDEMLPKIKRRPKWKLPELKATLPAIKEMIRSLESQITAIRGNIHGMRSGRIPQGKTPEWVAKYLEVMPAAVDALAYSKCILEEIARLKEEKMRKNSGAECALDGMDDMFIVDL